DHDRQDEAQESSVRAKDGMRQEPDERHYEHGRHCDAVTKRGGAASIQHLSTSDTAARDPTGDSAGTYSSFSASRYLLPILRYSIERDRPTPDNRQTQRSPRR